MRRSLDYKPLTDDQQATLLARCCPQGLAWDSKGNTDSILYKLLLSLATEINALENRIYRLITQWDIRITEDLILEWETAVGIPDECRAAAEDIATRRSDVLTKLKKIPIITIADYETLALAVTGESGWNIRPGIDDMPANLLYRFVLLVSPPSSATSAFTMPMGSGTQTLGVGDLTSVSTTATVAFSDTSSIQNGGTVVVSGATQTEYNGTFTIENVVLNTSFDYTFAGSGTSPATGTIVINFGLNQTRLDLLATETPPKFLFKTDVAFPGYPLTGLLRSIVLQCVFRKVTPANVVVVFD